MGRTCSARRHEKCIQHLIAKFERKYHFGVLGVDGRIILRVILEI